MPELSIARPRSISEGIRSLLSSSPNLSAREIMDVEERASNAGYRDTLAAKAREEIAAAQAARAFRENPDNALEMAAVNSGLTVPTARRLRHWINTEEGERPDVPAEAERQFRSIITSAIANLIGTAPSNAQQVARAGNELHEQSIRRSIAATPDVALQNQLKAAITSGYREPYSGGVSSQGLAANQETGQATVASPTLHAAAVEALQALTGQREASGRAATMRANTGAAQAQGVAERRAAQTERDRANASLVPVRGRMLEALTDKASAQAGATRARAAAAEEKTSAERESKIQASIRSKFRADPAMKGYRLGAWDAQAQRYEVRDRSGALKGHFDDK